MESNDKMQKQTNKKQQHKTNTHKNTLKKSVQIPVGTEVRIGNEANSLIGADVCKLLFRSNWQSGINVGA